MAEVLIYTSPWCGYCGRARRVLERHGVRYEEIDLRRHPEREAEMIRRSGRFTVPQIFIDGRSIGGSDELVALDRSGELEALLNRDEDVAEAEKGA